MQQNNAGKKRRRRATILALILAVIMILGIALPVFSLIANGMTVTATQVVSEEEETPKLKVTPEVKNPNFSISAAIGFDQKYLVEHTTPFVVTVENKGGDFTGEIQLKVYNYAGDENYGGDYYIYYQPVELAAGAVKQIKMDVDVNMICSVFEVRLTDASETVVCSKNVAATALDPATVMVGILTGRKTDLTYLANMKLAEKSAGMGYDVAYDYNAATFLDKDTFPESARVLENFRALIVNDFDTASLSDAQRSALSDWVDAGGMLMVGTGPNAAKTLGGLSEIVNCALGETKNITSFPNLSALTGTEVSGTMYSQTLEVPEESTGLLEENGETILWKIPVGNGNVLLHTFDLSLEPASTTNQMEAALASLYFGVDPMQYQVMNDDYYYYDSMSNVATNIAPLEMDRIYVVFIILAVYVFAVGPILYLVLKKKDKREKGWIIIPAMAVLVTVVIYGLSLGSDYRKGIVNVISVVDLSGGSAVGEANIYGAVATPRKGAVQVSTKENFGAVPALNNSYYYYGYRNNPDETYSAKIRTGGNTELTFFDNQSWASNTFKGSKIVDMGGDLTADLTIDGKRFQGTLTNETTRDFSDVLVILGNEYLLLDGVNAGESLEIDHEIGTTLEGLDYYGTYQLLRQAFGGASTYELRERVKAGEIDNYRAYEIGQRIDILSNYIDQMTNGYGTGGLKGLSGNIPVTVYAFSTDRVLEEDPVINGKSAVSAYQNLYCYQMELDLNNVDSFDIPGGLIHYSTVTGENGGTCYDEGMYIYFPSKDTYYFNYTLDYSGVIELFQIGFGENMGGYAPPDGMEILNLTTGDWEPLSNEPYTNPYDYFGEGGIMTLKIVVDEEYMEFAAPQLRVKGGRG